MIPLIPRPSVTFVAATAILVLAACSSGTPDRRGYAGNPMGDSARIFVTNLNFMEVTVYGVTTGSRRTSAGMTVELDSTLVVN